jgi:hypothetical protein
MSGTVNYPKVIDHLTDVITELNVPCAEPPAVPAEPSQEERQRDAVGLLKELLSTLEQGSPAAGAAAAGAAEHGASSQKGALATAILSHKKQPLNLLTIPDKSREVPVFSVNNIVKCIDTDPSLADFLGRTYKVVKIAPNSTWGPVYELEDLKPATAPVRYAYQQRGRSSHQSAVPQLFIHLTKESIEQIQIPVAGFNATVYGTVGTGRV